ncbi:hypothetical protein AWB95_07550 [Mycobacterium celatum]|nr:hypothetical protein AWB95_07550 [Mycobacterium celatum]
MLRGLVYAAAMVVVRLFQGTLINAFQTQAALISIVLLILFIIGIVVWGIRDGRADAWVQPDPDRRGDLAMVWLLAGLVAGIVSGAVAWLISLLYKGLYAGGLINELTTFAAFTALLVFLGGIGGATLGRWLIDRKGNYAPQPRGGGEEDRVDTDVFAAVRPDDTATQGGAMHQQQASSVATAEREATTAPQPAYSESPTEEIKLSDVEAPTEAKPAEAEAQTEKAKPEDQR